LPNQSPTEELKRGLATAWASYKDWGERNKQALNKIPGVGKLLEYSDKIAETPGMDYAIPTGLVLHQAAPILRDALVAGRQMGMIGNTGTKLRNLGRDIAIARRKGIAEYDDIFNPVRTKGGIQGHGEFADSTGFYRASGPLVATPAHIMPGRALGTATHEFGHYLTIPGPFRPQETSEAADVLFDIFKNNPELLENEELAKSALRWAHSHIKGADANITLPRAVGIGKWMLQPEEVIANSLARRVSEQLGDEGLGMIGPMAYFSSEQFPKDNKLAQEALGHISNILRGGR